MDPNFWLKKWEAGDIQSHRLDVNPKLLKFEEVILRGPVFVPLCGKTLDMDYLQKRGHSVVGVELSEIACRAFFEENKRTFKIEKREGFKVFEGEGVQIWCGDLFKLPLEALREVTSVYDRAALVALPPAMREAYAKYLKQLLQQANPYHQMLLITLEYDQKLAEPPPHSIPEAEVRRLYSDHFQVNLLEREENREMRKRPKFEKVTLFEAAYQLSALKNSC